MTLRLSSFCWSLALSIATACGAARDGLYESDVAPSGADSADDTSAAPIFPGAGTSAAADPLVPGLGPESTSECNPEPSTSVAGAAPSVQTVCFYSEGEPNVPAATIEQVVEVVGNTEWVHIRLILNPTFADNSYGESAVGWAGDDASAAPAPPEPMTMPAGAGAMADRAPRARPPRAGKSGHEFKDLVGSDHAEIQLLDAAGNVALHFKLDYLSESASSASGYASLGVSGGEGKMLAGDAASILGSSTSMDRNLNACGLDGFVEDSPSTDESYAPSSAAPAWDYRVIYEVWVAVEAFGSAGFGSALIESVHASPSKTGENTETVTPGPCPPTPGSPSPQPQPLPPVLTEIR